METKPASAELLQAIAAASAAYNEMKRAAELTPEAARYAELKERVRVLHAEHNATTPPSMVIEYPEKYNAPHVLGRIGRA